MDELPQVYGWPLGFKIVKFCMSEEWHSAWGLRFLGDFSVCTVRRSAFEIKVSAKVDEGPPRLYQEIIRHVPKNHPEFMFQKWSNPKEGVRVGNLCMFYISERGIRFGFLMRQSEIGCLEPKRCLGTET